MRWEWERRFGREGLGEKAWEEEKTGGRGNKKGGEKNGREEGREKEKTRKRARKSKTVETKMYCTMQK